VGQDPVICAQNWLTVHVEVWIKLLGKGFKVNTALAREKAKRKRYGPTRDKSAIDYFYSKLNLSHNSLPDWRDEDLFEEIWLTLPVRFQSNFKFFIPDITLYLCDSIQTNGKRCFRT